jgi:hypothetical protein
MNPITLAKYLLGDRLAIHTIAANRWSLLVGLLLVGTAGLSRNYDGVDLAREWPVLLHGPAVSTGNALILYSLVFGAAAIRKGVNPPFIPGFLSFLGLFWMTAPMAWLYAIPYERFLTPVEAVEANLWTLAFVSAWRVALMSRVLGVLYGGGWASITLLVLLFSDAVVFVAATSSPRPLLDLMGGLQHSPEELVRMNAEFAAQVWSFLAAPVLLIASVVMLRRFRPGWSLIPGLQPRFPAALLIATLGVYAAFAVIGAAPQREQRLRLEAEALLTSGHVAEAIAAMESRRRDEYPPIWDPPPKLGYRNEVPSMNDVRRALETPAANGWARDLYFDKSWREVRRHSYMWNIRPPSDREAFIAALESGKAPLPDRLWQPLAFHMSHDPRLTSEQRERLDALLNAQEERREEDASPAGS